MQQFLAIGALVLLSTIALQFYRSSSNQTTVSYANEAMLTATGVAQSVLEEIQTKAFDENTRVAACTTAAALSLTLGPESGETTNTQYDDIDDYNNSTRSITTSRLGNYNVSVKVTYANPASPESISYSPTFAKKVVVSVLNDYLLSASNTRDTLKLQAIIAY